MHADEDTTRAKFCNFLNNVSLINVAQNRKKPRTSTVKVGPPALKHPLIWTQDTQPSHVQM